jgi:hypothetical protein
MATANRATSMCVRPGHSWRNREARLSDNGWRVGAQFSLLQADNMVLQESCEQAVFEKGQLQRQLEHLHMEHELMVTSAALGSEPEAAHGAT